MLRAASDDVRRPRRPGDRRAASPQRGRPRLPASPRRTRRGSVRRRPARPPRRPSPGPCIPAARRSRAQRSCSPTPRTGAPRSAASVLMASPLRAPLLLARRHATAGRDAARARGARARPARRTRAARRSIRVGDVPQPDGPARRPTSAARTRSRLAARDRPRSQRAAGGRVGDAVDRRAVGPTPRVRDARRGAGPRSPATRSCSPTRDARARRDTQPRSRRHEQPRIYVARAARARSAEGVAASSCASSATVTRIGGRRPGDATRSPSRASRRRRSAGASSTPATASSSPTPRRPLDAAAAAPLSASGTLRPAAAARRRRRAAAAARRTTCSTSSPATTSDPVRGVYNHGWIIGDENAISAARRRASTPCSRSPPSTPEPSQHERSRASRRLRADREVTVDDVRQLMGASTPHFALQLRNRIAQADRAACRADHPARIEGEREIARLDGARARRRGPRHAAEAGHRAAAPSTGGIADCRTARLARRD